MLPAKDQKTLHENLDAYYAKGYLQTWCTQVRLEWTEFLHRVFCSLPIPTAENGPCWVMDVGCGPSVSNIISASAYSSHILLSDFLQSNRDEVESFWKEREGAFDWSHYFTMAGILELNPREGEIERRTREAIKGVYFCDVTREEDTFLVEDIPKFDVVIASLVFDVVAVSEEAFAGAMRNVSKHMKQPGGLMVIQGSLGESSYSVGSAMFPAMNIDEKGLKRIFEKEGMCVKKWELCAKTTTHYFALLQKT